MWESKEANVDISQTYGKKMLKLNKIQGNVIPNEIIFLHPLR